MFAARAANRDKRAACRSGAPSAPPRPMGTTPNQSSLHCCQKCAEHKLRDPIRGCLGESRSAAPCRSEEHTSELQSLMRISYAVFCLKKKNNNNNKYVHTTITSITRN